jgi:hypothetical protein
VSAAQRRSIQASTSSRRQTCERPNVRIDRGNWPWPTSLVHALVADAESSADVDRGHDFIAEAQVDRQVRRPVVHVSLVFALPPGYPFGVVLSPRKRSREKRLQFRRGLLMRRGGFEPPTRGLEVGRSHCAQMRAPTFLGSFHGADAASMRAAAWSPVTGPLPPPSIRRSCGAPASSTAGGRSAGSRCT